MRGAGLLGPALVLTLLGAPAAHAADAAREQDSWSNDQARVPGAQAAGRDGEGALVAVLDTWVDRAHPDFEGRVLEGADCIGGTCRAGQRTDSCDHGTHVAGTVASSSYGVAPRARVLPVRVLAFEKASGDCVGRPADVAAGIRWAVVQGAQVINLSLGADAQRIATDSAIPQAVDDAAEAGALVVFSAGNDDLPVADTYGGRALIVAATGPDGQLASYSQHGRGISLAAPGGDPAVPGSCTQADCVTSLYPHGGYAVAAGTSMAAPLVSGVAALLLGQDPTRTPQQVARRLRSTARPLEDAGAGTVDATAALGVRPAVPRSTPSKRAPLRAAASAPPPASPLPAPSALPEPEPLALAQPVASLPAGPVAVAVLLVLLAGGGVLVTGRRPG